MSTATISCSTPDAIIRYEIGGADPTESSPLYSSPVEFSGEIRAKAWKNGMLESDIAVAVSEEADMSSLTPKGFNTSINRTITNPTVIEVILWSFNILGGINTMVINVSLNVTGSESIKTYMLSSFKAEQNESDIITSYYFNNDKICVKATYPEPTDELPASVSFEFSDSDNLITIDDVMFGISLLTIS